MIFADIGRVMSKKIEFSLAHFVNTFGKAGFLLCLLLGVTLSKLVTLHYLNKFVAFVHELVWYLFVNNIENFSVFSNIESGAIIKITNEVDIKKILGDSGTTMNTLPRAPLYFVDSLVKETWGVMKICKSNRLLEFGRICM